MNGLTLTIPVPAMMPIGDALRRASGALGVHAQRSRVTVCEPIEYTIVVQSGVPHLTARAQFVELENPECGTDTGYHYHRRKYQTPPCDACKHAHAQSEKRRKMQKRWAEEAASAGDMAWPESAA